MKNIKTSLYFLPLLLIFTMLACSDENPVPQPAPDIPLKSTMVMDFDDFTGQDTTGKSTVSYQHWGRAAAHVWVWNTAITINLVVPVASFHEAFNHEAVYDPGTETWTWSYNFWAAGAIHLAKLQAQLISEGVEWKMFISKTNAFTDFLWYSGVSNIDYTSGYWELKSNPQDPTDFLLIEWNRNPQNETADIKYTNVIPEGDGNGSYIFYGTDVNPANAFYNLYGSQEDNLVNIEWDRDNKDGRIKDEVFFGDTDWRCWDTDLLDADCN